MGQSEKESGEGGMSDVFIPLWSEGEGDEDARYPTKIFYRKAFLTLGAANPAGPKNVATFTPAGLFRVVRASHIRCRPTDLRLPHS
jgi:hypothetical protein